MSDREASNVPPRLEGSALEARAEHLPAWRIVEGHRLARLFLFPDFAAALAFTQKVGALAEAEGHHPDIHLAWGKVELELRTHDAGGLTELDFALAEKISQLTV